MNGNTIGSLNWTACEDCKHCDPEEGGCAVDDDEWKAALEHDGDLIDCGSWESREPLPPIPQNQGPALPGFEKPDGS